MGLLLIPVFIIYLLLALISIIIAIKFSRSKIIVFGVVLFFIVFPFRRFLFYHTLFWYYSRSPLQEILETVEYPISVYWEDNVWPGFDAYGRHWMVKNYLDGEHLKLLALNGDDGKIYLYRATVNDYAASREILSEVERAERAYGEALTKAKESGTGKYDPPWVESRQIRESARVLRWQKYEPQKDKDVQAVMLKAEVYEDRKELPPMNYLVEFNNLPKTLFVNNKRKMIHADRLSVVDTRTGKEIAFSKRYMVYSWTRYFGAPSAFGYYKLGDERAYEFDDRVLFEFAKETRKGSECHSSLFHRNKKFNR